MTQRVQFSNDLHGILPPSWVIHEPTTPDAVANAEATLGVTFPRELALLLELTNGVSGEWSLAVVWPIERIVEDNLTFRASLRDLYMPFEHTLFFADHGNGDQFFFPITAAGEVRQHEVFSWNHEDDSRMWVAAGLLDYLRRMAAGQITT